MIGRRLDVLAAIPLRERAHKEAEDGRYVMKHIEVLTASAASLKRDANTWAGLDVFAAEHFTPHREGEPVSVIVCARVDLDHPIYFADNRFTECEDCGCELQYRPDVPVKPGNGTPCLCICCTARRVREAMP